MALAVNYRIKPDKRSKTESTEVITAMDLLSIEA